MLGAFVLSACTEKRLDESLKENPSTTAVSSSPTVGPVGGPTTTAPAPAGRVIARLAAVNTNDLKLGAAFNAQFLSLQFYAVGLDATEVQCAANRVVATAGADFGGRAVGQVMSGSGITPDVLTPCVSTDRLMKLASTGAHPDLSRAPADLLRSVFTELASAGYESAGLTAVEATCLADRVVGARADQQLAKLGTQLDLTGNGVEPALPDCLTPERISELAR